MTQQEVFECKEEKCGFKTVDESEMKDHKQHHFLETYGTSSKKNFRIVNDNIITPHPYCIAPVHLQYNDSMYLGDEQIRKMEADHPDKVMCDICKTQYRRGETNKILSYDEHEKALTVECKLPLTTDGSHLNKELRNYLLKKVKPICEPLGFKSFAFVDVNGKGAKTQ